MYICIYVYMYICIYEYMHICIYEYMNICICISIWVNYNDLTVLPHWKSWLGFGKLSPNGPTIQVSEIL